MPTISPTGERDTVSPTVRGERIERIDVLRGFALFGVLLVNLIESETVAPDASRSGIGQAIAFLAEGSFYPLFSFLFGLSFALQMTRFQERGAPFVAAHIRRSLTLVAIGMAAYTLALGDPILIHYGILALPLLLFRKSSPRFVLISALVTFAIVLGQPSARRAQTPPTAEQSFEAELQRAEERVTRDRYSVVLREGSYAELVAVRWQLLWRMLRNPWFYLGSRNLSMFMLFLGGLFVARRGFITKPEIDRPVLQNVAYIVGAVGLVGNAALLTAQAWTRGADPFVRALLSHVLYYTANPALGLAYGAFVVLLIETSTTWRRRLSPLRWTGRMALSNFLLQFVFMLGLLYAQRLGSFLYIRPGTVLVLSVVVFAAQLALSRWWLSRFRFGPAEWLWRTVSLGRLQPMRATAPTPLGVGA